MRFIRGRRSLAALGAVGALLLAAAAIAYFSASGSGTGTATVGTGSPVTLHASTGATLYPGTSSTVTFTADNPSSGNQKVGTIHLASVVACNAAFVSGACPSGHEVTSCESVETGSSDGNTANFWMPDVLENQDVAPGNGDALSGTGTLTMNDLTSSQDTCKSVNLLLNFTS